MSRFKCILVACLIVFFLGSAQLIYASGQNDYYYDPEANESFYVNPHTGNENYDNGYVGNGWPMETDEYNDYIEQEENDDRYYHNNSYDASNDYNEYGNEGDYAGRSHFMTQIKSIIIIFVIATILLAPVIAYIAFKIYVEKYFSSEEFLSIKKAIQSYTNECNELNDHIDELRSTEDIFIQDDYGEAQVYDQSKYNYQRKALKDFSNNHHVHNCSLSVCRAARNKPFQYVCKYFNVPKDEATLLHLEDMLNNFLAVEEGRQDLLNKKVDIFTSIYNQIPNIIFNRCGARLEKELGFKQIDLSDIHFPVYRFHYVSDGGNSSLTTDIQLNPDIIERFINFIDSHIKWEKSIRGQRSLMTASLRQQIKERDNFTCCKCGNSIFNEPNLLLEIDHIVPVSKGGLTEEGNLQTLCWKCNRTKGAKIE